MNCTGLFWASPLMTGCCCLTSSDWRTCATALSRVRSGSSCSFSDSFTLHISGEPISLSITFRKGKTIRNLKEAMATYQVTPPEPFTFTRPEEWQKWIRRFELFRKASGLELKQQEAQVNTLIICGSHR